MPESDKLEAMQVMPATLMERLALAVGQPVVVYLMGVHAHIAVTPPHPGWPTAPYATAPPWCPPMPGPGPCPPMPGPAPAPTPVIGTAVVSGVLVFAGVDYIAVRVGTGTACRDVLIPYNAIGMIIPGGLMV